MKQYNSTALVHTIWSLLLVISALCLMPTTAQAQTTPQNCSNFELVGRKKLSGRPAIKGAIVPTGMIYIDFQPLKAGTPPYKFEIIEHPASYTGRTVFTSSSTSNIIYNIPSGNYVVNVSDATGCTQTITGVIKEENLSGSNSLYTEPFTQEFTSPDHPRWVATPVKSGKGGNGYYYSLDSLNVYLEFAICTQEEYRKYKNYEGELNWMSLEDSGTPPTFAGDYGVWHVKAPERTSWGDTVIVEKPYLFIRLPDDGPSPNELYFGSIREPAMTSLAIRVKGVRDPKCSAFNNNAYGGYHGEQSFDPNHWLDIVGGNPSPCEGFSPAFKIKKEWLDKLTYPVTITVEKYQSYGNMSLTFATKEEAKIPKMFEDGDLHPVAYNRIYMKDSGGKDSSLGFNPSGARYGGLEYSPRILYGKYYRDSKVEWDDLTGWEPKPYDGKIGWDYCAGTRDVVFYMTLSEERYSRFYKVPAARAELTLISAPDDYTPQNKYFPKIGEPIQISPNHNSSFIFPFPNESAPEDTPYMAPCFDIKIPKGSYRFKLKYYNYCGEEKEWNEVGKYFTFWYDEVKYELANEGQDLKPEIEKVSCDKIRVYPFRGANSRGILLRNGEPATIYARARQTTIDSNGNEKFIDSGTTYFNPADDTQNPEDCYIELPWKTSTIKIQYNYESIGNFTEVLPCLQLGTELTIEATTPSYDRDQLYNYICLGGQTAYVSVRPIHTAGETIVELRDVKDINKLYAKKTLLSKDQGKSVVFELTGDNVQPEYKLYIRTGSGDCLLDNNGEIIKMNNLGGSSFITDANDTKYCEGDTVKLACPPIRPESKYIWTEPDGTTKHQGRQIIIPNATRAITGKWTLEITDVPCDGAPATQTVPFILSVAPSELWWRKEASSADWNSLDNWADSEGKPIKAIPARCTDVHLPAVVDDYYPNLDPTKTDTLRWGVPECNDIYFHFGSALGEPQRLTHYSRAFIDYNFGIVQSDGTIKAYEDPKHPGAYGRPLERDRWYMISTPLKNVYAGDFSLGAHPLAYQRYLKVKRAPNQLAEASFDIPISKQGRSMAIYNHALAFKVEGYHPEKLGAKDHTNLNGLQGIIRLPYYENTERAPYYPLHHYSKTRYWYKFNEVTQKWEVEGSLELPTSYFAYFDMKDLRPLTRVDSVKRDPVLDYRFLFENDTTMRIGTTFVVTGNEKKEVEGYTLKLNRLSPTRGRGTFVLVGNPFMSPISYERLYNVNQDAKDLIKGLYIFTNGAWRYTEGRRPRGKSVKDPTLDVIPPLQAFIIYMRSSGPKLSLYFPTEPEHSVLVDPNSTDGRGAELRSADEDEESDEITERYVAVTVTDDKGGYASAVLLPEDTEESTPALMAPEGMQTAPLVYFISPTDSTCNFVQTNVPSAVVELGVFAPTDGMLTLDFTTLAEKPFDKLALYDRLRGTEQDLLVNPTYSYGYSERDGRRFELRMSYGNVRYEEQQDHQPDLAIERTATGYRISYDQGIAGYQLYSVHGYLLERATTDGQTQVDIEMPETEVVLLDVQSADGLRWIKKLQR